MLALLLLTLLPLAVVAEPCADLTVAVLWKPKESWNETTLILLAKRWPNEIPPTNSTAMIVWKSDEMILPFARRNLLVPSKVHGNETILPLATRIPSWRNETNLLAEEVDKYSKVQRRSQQPTVWRNETTLPRNLLAQRSDQGSLMKKLDETTLSREIWEFLFRLVVFTFSLTLFTLEMTREMEAEKETTEDSSWTYSADDEMSSDTTSWISENRRRILPTIHECTEPEVSDSEC